MDHFEHELTELRQEKDQFFKTNADSPIPAEHRSTFKGLVYYSIDKAYRVLARLQRSERPVPILISTSTGEQQSYLKYGSIEFHLTGRPFRLIVYKSSEDPFSRSMFIPFSDETSGSETYGSGRYLDIEEEGGDEYDLDFNLAYNPYCAYNDHYTCPIPPRESRLSIKVLAGEKNYK